MKLTLRDLMWLVAIVAIAVSGVVEHRARWQQYEAAATHFAANRRPRYFEPGELSVERNVLASKLRRSTNPELVRGLEALLVEPLYIFRADEYEAHLVEMANRRMHVELQRCFDAQCLEDESSEVEDWIPPRELELITALRRAQGKPDPLQIVIGAPKPKLKSSFPPTVVMAVLTNVDAGKQSLAQNYTAEGERSLQWRFRLVDERGMVVRDSNYSSSQLGGGSAHGYLEFGDVGSKYLDLRYYVAPPKSGRYRLQVLYHSSRWLAVEPDLTGLIVSASEPIEVEVYNPDDQWLARIFLRAASPLVAIPLVLATLLALQFGLRVASWRDWVWCLLVVALSSVWTANNFRLQDRVDKVRLDCEAPWSLRIVD